MRGPLVALLVAVIVTAGIIACNAITGAGDLAVCQGAECAALDGGTIPGDERPNGNGDGSTNPDAGDDGALPPSCTGDEKRCSGTVAAKCVGGTFQTTNCAETCVNGDCMPFPSCRNAAGGACGADGGVVPDGGGGGTSCCESLAVAPGAYNRNNDATKPATVSAFKLDKYEVTVGRFRAFVEAGEGTRMKPPPTGGGVHPKIPNSGWNAEWNDPVKNLLPVDTNALKGSLGGGTWTDMPGANELRPITNVSWFNAFAFCIWDGGRLPTNAEWGYAAGAGSEQRLFPWVGTTIEDGHAAYDCNVSGASHTTYTYCSTQTSMEPCSQASCAALANPGTCLTGSRGCAGFPSEIAFVGAHVKGAGRWGQLDLAGNVAEWVLDQSGDKDNILLPTPCNDCANLVPGNPEGPASGGNDDIFMIVRGGHWNVLDTSLPLRNTSAEAEDFETRTNYIGFRCAR